MFDAERSVHEIPALVLMNTPALAVNSCGLPALLPEYVQTSVPSFKAWILKGWPCVRGGAARRCQDALEPFWILVET
jgi:hypothetical protein